MAVTTPTIIENASTGVTVQGVNGFTYEQFLNSLGSNIFRVMNMFLTASSMAQISQDISFSIFDANGKLVGEVISIQPDPYQKVPSYLVDLTDRMVILNGQSSLSFNLLAGEQLMIQLRSEQYNVSDSLNPLSPPNKSMLAGVDEHFYAGGIGGVGTATDKAFEPPRATNLRNLFWLVVTATIIVSLVNYDGKKITDR